MEREEVARAVERFAPAVYRLAFARTGNRSDAEDIMQEVFLRLMRAELAFADDAHCKAWLLRVAANCANDLFRKPWHRHTQPLDEDLPAPEKPEEGGTLEAVLSLPPGYRIVVHLFYYEGLPVAEIAATLGKREDAIRTRLRRARAMLRDKLKGDERYV